MFSGIVEAQGAVSSIHEEGMERRVSIRRPPSWKLKLGESVCVEGVCSTVQKVNGRSFEVWYMPETLRRTTLARLRCSDRVNLERSLRLNSLVGGHLVQGHVDVVGHIVGVHEQGKSRVFEFAIPRRFSRHFVDKGSVAVDGISLTVVKPSAGKFSVSLLEYTLRHTTLGSKQIGDPVNVEVDVLSKYVAKLLGR